MLAARAACALEESIQRLILASDQNLGHLERQVAADVQELLWQSIERGAQAKADAAAPHCPVCGQALSRLSHGHARTFETRFGSISVAIRPQAVRSSPSGALSLRAQAWTLCANNCTPKRCAVDWAKRPAHWSLAMERSGFGA